MGDGMVSMGSIIIKPNAKKIRRIRSKSTGGGGDNSSNNNNKPTTTTNPAADGTGEQKVDDNNSNMEKFDEDGGTIVGFAGTTADAFTLLERLESKLDEYPGQLARSCVELAKGWRTDKYLRRLEASLLVADAKASFEITGNGDVLESHDGVLGVGSGSAYAMAAARALMMEPNLSAEEVAQRAMRIGEIYMYIKKERNGKGAARFNLSTCFLHHSNLIMMCVLFLFFCFFSCPSKISVGNVHLHQ